MKVPGSADPGKHGVTVTEQTSGLSAGHAFLVQVNLTHFHFDSGNTGLNPYENTLTTGNVNGLTSKWSYLAADFVTTSPAVVNGVVYFGSTAGNTGGTLYALKASTGKKAWGYTPLHGQLHGFPRGGGRVVYVGDTCCYIHAVDAATGTPLWSFPTGFIPGPRRPS